MKAKPRNQCLCVVNVQCNILCHIVLRVYFDTGSQHKKNVEHNIAIVLNFGFVSITKTLGHKL